MSRAGARALRAARGVVAETSSVFLSSGLDRPMAPDRFSLGEIGRRVPMFIQAFRSLSLAYAYERMIPALWLTWPRLSFLGPWPARTAVPQPLCLTFPVCADTAAAGHFLAIKWMARAIFAPVSLPVIQRAPSRRLQRGVRRHCRDWLQGF
jgi:hypothetical protein